MKNRSLQHRFVYSSLVTFLAITAIRQRLW